MCVSEYWDLTLYQQIRSYHSENKVSVFDDQIYEMI